MSSAGLARGHRKIAHRKRRVERLARPKQTLHAGEDDVHGRRKLNRLGGGHELLAGAHEQLVGEDFSKLGKRVADRRGAPAEPLRGARDARIDQKRVERHQQIGVDFLEVHGLQ
jgi:hypothetical protein